MRLVAGIARREVFLVLGFVGGWEASAEEDQSGHRPSKCYARHDQAAHRMADQPGPVEVSHDRDDRLGIVIEAGLRILDGQVERMRPVTEPHQLRLEGRPAPCAAQTAVDEDEVAQLRSPPEGSRDKLPVSSAP